MLAAPIISIAMEFGFCGEVSVANKMHSKYSELRQAILEHTATRTQTAAATHIQTANAQDIARMLMKAATSDDKSETVVADRPPLGFEQFVKLNFTTSIIKLQPIASELLRTVNEGETFRAEATSNRCHMMLFVRRSSRTARSSSLTLFPFTTMKTTNESFVCCFHCCVCLMC